MSFITFGEKPPNEISPQTQNDIQKGAHSFQFPEFLVSELLYIYPVPVEPHEAVPEVSKGKVHITQNKHVPIEWFVTTASQSRI